MNANKSQFSRLQSMMVPPMYIYDVHELHLFTLIFVSLFKVKSFKRRRRRRRAVAPLHFGFFDTMQLLLR